MKLKLFNEAEIPPPADFDDLTGYARDAIDHVTRDVIGYPQHWSAFTIETPSAIVLRVTPGRLYKTAAKYNSAIAIDVNVQLYLPVVGGDTVWVALLVRGVTATNNELRSVRVDADTGETVVQSVPKTITRDIEIVVQTGVPGPTPIKPSVASDQCCLAYVLLGTGGAVTIDPGEAWRAKSLYEVEGRVTALEIMLIAALQRIATLETDLAALAARLKMIPRPEIIRQLQRDAAITRRMLRMPAEARGHWYDPGLIKEQWNMAHASWLARVRQGVRFAFANEFDARIELYNSADPLVQVNDNICLPVWTEQTRIEVSGSSGSKNISQQSHTAVTATQSTISRTAITYGPTFAACDNWQEWENIGGMRVGEVFGYEGETFEMVGRMTDPNQEVDLTLVHTYAPDATVEEIVVNNNNAGSAGTGHIGYAMRQVEYHSWNESYWSYVTTNYGVNGSIYAQSFLVASPMIVTSIELHFARVGASGDVHLSLVEVNDIGAPDLQKTLARCTVTQANLATGWVKFPITPTIMEAGKRYAWATITTGNHAIYFVGNNSPDNPSANQYAQGTMFWITDGLWAQGSIGEDFAFRVNAAKFAQNRSVVEFQPLSLENGMTEFRLTYPGWHPDGTSLVWEIQPSGDTEWYVLVPMVTNPLNGLPSLVRLRATFIGTSDLMPSIELSVKARSLTGRCRADFLSIAVEAPFGFSTAEVVVETVVDNFYSAHHTIVNKFVSGGVVYTAAATTIQQDLDKPQRRVVTSSFSIPATVNGGAPRCEMTTDAVTLVPFIQNQAMYAI